MTAVPPLDRERDVYPNGPPRLVLLGPPGTGKTHTVLSSWLEPALADGVHPSSVLSCSFTRAAAGELRERLARALDVEPGTLRATCATVHATAYRAVRGYFGDRRFHVLETRPRTDDDEEKDEAPEPAARIVEPEGETDARKAARRVWDLARNLLVFDVETTEFARLAAETSPEIPLDLLRTEIKSYEAEKKRDDAIDFVDMLNLARDVPAPRRELLVLDEAQDTSVLQWSLLDKWIEKSRRVVVVGDFDQTVHEWAGARSEKLFDLIRGGYAVRRLEKSYRVPRRAHGLARSLILKNRNRVDAPYEPRPEAGSLVVVSPSEAVAHVEGAVLEGRTAFVLARRAKDLDGYRDAFTHHGVPFVHERGGSPLGAPRQVGKARALLALRDGRPANRDDVRKLVEDLPGRPAGFYFTGLKRASVSAARALPERVGLDLLRGIGVNLRDLLDESLAVAFGRAKLEDKAEPLALLVELHGPDVFDRAPRVTLTTMHASKGREADLVVVVLDAPKRTAQAIATGGRKIVEAERRVLYVALTRTRDALVLVPASGPDLGILLGLETTRHVLGLPSPAAGSVP